MSCIDIVAALYFDIMNIDPGEPMKADRDRFVLSAGHKCMAQYAVLAEMGYFDKSVLDTYGSLGSHIPGHPDMHKLPGIEANTGALGHGLAIATGMALGLRSAGLHSRVYAIMGDGELAEGSNWEAFAAAAHHKADNLVAIIDSNGLQISGRCADIMNYEPIGGRIEAFGWAVEEINGNDMDEIIAALDSVHFVSGRPSAIIAHTTKGKGISFEEGKVSSHYWKPTQEELKQAEKEIHEAIRTIGGYIHAMQ
jgi:transketolase